MATFSISPEREASLFQFVYRQLFVNPPAISPDNVDLTGKTAIVTGSNGGLGLALSSQLLELGLSRLIISVRDEIKGEAAKRELRAAHETSNASIEVWKLDLASYDSVTAFAKRAESLDRLDIVVLNAGVHKRSRLLNANTQHEETLQVNYLSTMLLAILLLPVLVKSQEAYNHPGRLVLVSSDMAAWAAFPERVKVPLLPAFDDETVKFDGGDRYSTTKLLGQLFLTQLAQRVSPSKVIMAAVNPGLNYGSELAREFTGIMWPLFLLVSRTLGRPVHIGARALADAAVRHGSEIHGQYVEDGKLTPMAPLVYRPDGERIGQLLWRETMSELSFAAVEDIIRDL